MLTLIRNADIHTMHPAMPRAEAAVLQDGRFVFVGTEEGARLWLCGAGSHQVLDAEGCSVVPGFNDAHMHYVHAATQAENVDLSAAGSIEEAICLLRDGLAGRAGTWLIGEHWNQERFAERRLLTRQDLDAVSGDVPVIASRACGHIMAANSRALSIAGINVADGILREEEQGAVWKHVPPLDEQTVRRLMLAAQAGLWRQGITSVQSDDLGGMGPQEAAAMLGWIRESAANGRFRLRYAAQVRPNGLPALEALLDAGLHTAFQDEWCRVSCIKLMADGSLGARTAWLQAEYADAPGTRGLSLYTDETLHALVRLATRHGVPVAVHAIGDAAMEQTLNAIAQEGGGLRHAVVHAQITTGQQVRRCGELGLTLLVQPIFLDADIPIVRPRVGDALADTSYRWRALRGAGAHVAFGTDCPVEPYRPMPGLYCAVTRQTLDGGAPYLPAEAFTLEEALYAYTAAGAYATGEEAYKGRIAPGMLADFVLLDRCLDAKAPASLLETGVRATYIDGECVYSA